MAPAKRIRRSSSSSSDSDYDGSQTEENPSSSKSIISVPPPEEEFYVKHKKLGHALIIVNETFFASVGATQRKGTEKDVTRLSNFFKKIELDVEICRDYCDNDIKSKLNEVASKDHKDSTCLIIVAMTHGKNGSLAARNAWYDTETLWNPFAPELCPSLVGKPKIFFIQACRGAKYDVGTTVHYKYDNAEVGNKQSPDAIPVMADFLMFYSAFQGYLSYIHSTKGSRFIHCLVKQLRKNHDTKDFLSILTDVNKSVAFYKVNERSTPEVSSIYADQERNMQKQMCTIVSTLTRKFVLTNDTKQYDRYKEVHGILHRQSVSKEKK